MNHKMIPIPERDRELTYNGVYTSEELADLLGVTPSTVRNWYKNGYISGYEFGNRGYLRYTVECVIPWLKKDIRSRKKFLNHTPKREFLRAHKKLILQQEPILERSTRK